MQWNLKPVFTFTSRTASLIGQQSCCLCFLEVWQTTQMGSLSNKQYSLSFSLWAGHISPGSQYSSPPVSSTGRLSSCTHDSHRFFRVRLGTGSSRFWVLHSGQSRLRPLPVQYCCRQGAQKLWVHLRTTGSLKMAQHMGQVRSSSGRDSLPAILTLLLVYPERESRAKVQKVIKHRRVRGSSCKVLAVCREKR